jgi:hypothetical protein
MRNHANHLALALIGALGASACAASHVGTWEHRQTGEYFRAVLNADGTCALTSERDIGDLRTGLRTRCRYSREGDVISIVEVGDLDGLGPLRKDPHPMQFRVRSDPRGLEQMQGNRANLLPIVN